MSKEEHEAMPKGVAHVVGTPEQPVKDVTPVGPEQEERVPMTLRLNTNPVEVRVLEYGENPCIDGRPSIHLDSETARTLVARQEQTTPIMIDFASDSAVGSCRMEARRDGLWAVNIRWNEDARPLDGGLHLVPSVVLDSDRKTIDVCGLAITATPLLARSTFLMPRWFAPLELKVFDMRITRMVQQGWRIDERTELEVKLSAPKNLQGQPAAVPTVVSNAPESLEKSASEAIRWAYKCSLELRTKWAALVAARLTDPTIGNWQDYGEAPRQKLFEAVIEGAFKDAMGAELAELTSKKITSLFLARVMSRKQPTTGEKSEG